MTRTEMQRLRDHQQQPESMVSDDVVALKRYLTTASFDYVDVGLVSAREKALSSWPLLAESITWYENQR